MPMSDLSVDAKIGIDFYNINRAGSELSSMASNTGDTRTAYLVILSDSYLREVTI